MGSLKNIVSFFNVSQRKSQKKREQKSVLTSKLSLVVFVIKIYYGSSTFKLFLDH